MPDSAREQSDSPSATPPKLPASPVRILAMVLIALTGGAALTGWFEYSGTQSYTAYLQTQGTTLTAPRAARIEQILVQSGEVVETEQPLVDLADDQLLARWSDKQQEVAALKFELEQAQAQADVELDTRLRQLQAEVFETRLRSANFLKNKYASQVEALAWEDFLKDYDALSSGGPAGDSIPLIYKSGMPDEKRIQAMLKHEAAVNQLEVHTAQVELCEQRLQELETIERELPEKVRRAAGVEVAQARLNRAVEELKRLERQKSELTLKAPGYGTVGLFRKRPGDRTGAGEAIVELFDEDRPFLIVRIPSTDLAGIEAGSQVELQFPGGENRFGVIRNIPPQTEPAHSAGAASQARPDLVVLQIDPVGQLWPQVPIGTAVRVRLGK